MTSLKLAVFDFDQTLSACHVYYAISGGEGGIPVPPPYARSERGQLARIAELDALPDFASCGGFAVVAFGGPERVARMQAVFEELRAAGVECIVCSRGLVGPIRKCLDQVGLLRYFREVYANAGPGGDGTDYDLRLPPGFPSGPESRFLGSSTNTGWGSKGRLVARLLRERGLQQHEAVFVDDTASEIDNVRGVCHTIHVQPPQGMGPREFDQLRRLLATGNEGGWGSIFEGITSPGGPAQPPRRRYDSFDPQQGPPASGIDPGLRSGADGFPSPPIGQAPAAEPQEEWWGGTPQHPPPPPPPPPPRRRTDTAESGGPGIVPTPSHGAMRSPTNGGGAGGAGASAARVGAGGGCSGGGAAGGGDGWAPADAKSFINIGPWWGGGSEFGPSPPPQGGPYAGMQHRPPPNLYRDEDLPVCCWFQKNGKRRGPNQPPPCTVM
mmetsp:Transcript_114261/g.287161  ORF Transcript_114261/g.287161 Transcript_114261/m.287161 type:complete len:439 (+) Transcript_114261:186-1502(+)